MRLKDGGFEHPEFDAWEISPYGSGPDVTHVHSGLLAMKLRAVAIVATPPLPLLREAGQISQTIIPTTIGESLAVAGWIYNPPIGLKTQVQLWADGTVGDGSALELIESIVIDSIPLGWNPHIWPPVHTEATSTTLAFRLTPPTQAGETVVWLDDLALAGDDDVAKRSRWLAHQRLVTVLKGINGAGGGYFTDLQNRVFTKIQRPQGGPAPPFPYLCVPLVNTNPKVEHDATWVRHTWTVPIMLFVAETNVGAYDSDAIAALYHLGEDVYQAVMRDPVLGGYVSSASFVSGGIEQGGTSALDGLPFADAVIPLELSIHLGLDVIGP